MDSSIDTSIHECCTVQHSNSVRSVDRQKDYQRPCVMAFDAKPLWQCARLAQPVLQLKYLVGNKRPQWQAVISVQNHVSCRL